MNNKMNYLNVDEKKLAALCRNYSILLVVLHGSHASGHARENSDIDVFILVKNKEMKSRIEPYIENLSVKCVDLYGNRLSPYILTGYEVKQKKDLGIIAEINKGIQIIPVQE